MESLAVAQFTRCGGHPLQNGIEARDRRDRRQSPDRQRGASWEMSEFQSPLPEITAGRFCFL